ncbi:PfkB family carbohydrate kinase [Agrobacterium pusense]|uniref:PfkB family carbohydrate kinase n=1 Tax=Agrobacterium pusense TaxID=648995 RepID=UPI003FD1B1A0
MAKKFDNDKVGRRFVRTIAGAASGMSVATFDSEDDRGAMFVSGTNLRLGVEDVEAVSEIVKAGAVLVLQKEVPDEANVAAAAVMKRAGGMVVLNAAPARAPSDGLAALVDVVVVNAVEAEALAAVASVESLETALAAAQTLSKQYPVVVVTAGGEGVAFVARGGDEGATPAIKVNVGSTHGAGDEFIAYLRHKLRQVQRCRLPWLRRTNLPQFALASLSSIDGRDTVRLAW